MMQSSDPGSPADSSIKDDSSKPRYSRYVEAPPLIIPSHLKEIYCQDNPQRSERPGWSNHESQNRRIQQPLLRSPSVSCPTSPQHYHQVPRGMRDPRHMDSPSSPHYGVHQYSHMESPMLDYRDHYEHYGRTERQYAHVHSRLQPPRRYRPYPQTPVHHPIQNAYQHRQSPRTVAASPQMAVPSTPRRYHFDNDPCGFGRPYLPSTPPSRPKPNEASNPVAYKTSTSIFMRGRPNTSPERTQDFKRQRNESGVTHRLSDASLSSKVQDSLSLQEKSPGIINRSTEIKSPSGLLQGREHRLSLKQGVDDNETRSQAGFSGLAALSTAAFLKLDETPLS